MREVCVTFGLRILEMGVFPPATFSSYRLDAKLKMAETGQDRNLSYCVQVTSPLTNSHFGTLRK